MQINKTTQNRLKSRVLWASIASILTLTISAIAGVDNGLLGNIGELLLSLVALFGTVNNPTAGNSL